MNPELLTLLLPSSPSYELKSINHNSVTPQDISHLLANKRLKKSELNILLAKFIDSDIAHEELFNEMMDKACEIFMKDGLPSEPGIVKKFTRFALAETLFTKCFICKGVGTTTVNNSRIEKCPHCNGTGDFIYEDVHRAHIMKVPMKVYKKHRNQYFKIRDEIVDIENEALRKLGD
tara:strand:- start:832 stop:1359 length:528 start_codon:yes stop_codon:yes gene_type:complete